MEIVGGGGGRAGAGGGGRGRLVLGALAVVVAQQIAEVGHADRVVERAGSVLQGHGPLLLHLCNTKPHTLSHTQPYNGLKPINADQDSFLGRRPNSSLERSLVILTLH